MVPDTRTRESAPCTGSREARHSRALKQDSNIPARTQAGSAAAAERRNGVTHHKMSASAVRHIHPASGNPADSNPSNAPASSESAPITARRVLK